MKMETLIRFCHSRIGARPNLEDPFTVNGYTFATDGRIMVRVPAIPNANGHGVKMPPAFNFDHDACNAVWGNIPEVSCVPILCEKCGGNGRYNACTTCDGVGKVDCECLDCGNTHQRCCPRCGGSGKTDTEVEHRASCVLCDGVGQIIDRKSMTSIGCRNIANYYLALMRELLPDCQIEMGGDSYEMAKIRFNGGLGYIMPMRMD